MKFKSLFLISILSINVYASSIVGKETTYISLKAKAGQESKLSEFLIAGADLLKETEKDTLFWAALKSDKNTFVIFDTFTNEEARAKHFAGKVAAALNQNADALVEGAWDNGVIPNIHNSKILYAKVAKIQPSKITKAIFIPITAKAGKEQAFADFLVAGGALVSDLEPGTHYWYALQFDDNHFGIFDFFSDQNGVNTHFAGKVATALNENAEALVEGGWDNGVVDNIKAFDVLSLITQ